MNGDTSESGRAAGAEAAAAEPASGDPQILARQVGTTMFAADTASRAFMQMELLDCTPGRATMRLAVRAELLNGHQICHGGFLFTLADSTFAYACNSHNKATVAAGCSIEFLRPARLGDMLTCVGQEQTLQGRHGIYDMRVTNQNGEVVAMFRGKSTQIMGPVLPAG